jgi:tripartite-type tricarboxylate transporter receptor subunit TctC
MSVAKQREQINRFTHVLLAATAAVGIAQTAAAAYPEKSVRIVVPYPAGGAVDVVARKIAQKLTEQMGQTFYVENKPGAAGTIGTQDVARAKPDGYTLLAIDNSYTMLPYVFKKLPWDHDKAFVPITVSMFTPVLITVPANSKFKDLAGLLAYAKANPEKLTFGSGGSGSATHFAAEAFQQTAGVKLTHVPYKGAGDAMTALMSEQIDVLFVSTPSAVSQIKGGKVRALAVSGEKRLVQFPDIPTFAEAGLPSYSLVNWSGLAAPAGTPKETVERLHAEVKKALEAPDVKEFLSTMSANPGGMEPDKFTPLIKEETTRWSKVAEKVTIERQ